MQLKTGVVVQIANCCRLHLETFITARASLHLAPPFLVADDYEPRALAASRSGLLKQEGRDFLYLIFELNSEYPCSWSVGCLAPRIRIR
jgi:hypothetical protein